MHMIGSMQSAAKVALVATAVLATTVQGGKSGFDKMYRQHHVHHHKKHLAMEEPLEFTSQLANDTFAEETLSKRSGQCAFPYADGMVAVTPGSSNAGWAMSPDQPCTPGSYCPYACQPGFLSMQWDPTATTYAYPQSQYGGLYCGEDGTMSKPFPSRDYCVSGVGSVSAKNSMGSEVAFCQTVLPGNEAMLIPTSVGAGATQVLAVPDTSYWAATAAHYYINPAGVSTSEACVWGTTANPWGNWSPYVAGANTDDNGNTFVKIGWNPIYTDDDNWNSVVPTWGVKIECVGSGCNGTPCRCDPLLDGMNQCSSGSSGAGGASFCVVTVPSGGSANIVVYETSGSSSSESSSSSSSSSSSESYSEPSSSSSSSSYIPYSSTSETPYEPSTSEPVSYPSSTSESSSYTPSSTYEPIQESSSQDAYPTTAVNLKAAQVAPSISSSSQEPETTAEPTTSSYYSAPETTSTTPTATPTPTWTPTPTPSESSLWISSSSSISSSSIVLTTSSSVNINTSTVISSITSQPTPSFLNSTQPATRTSTRSIVLGAYGYQNLQAVSGTPSAAPSASASSTKKSGAPELLRMSPLLAFLGAIVVLARL